MDSNSRHSEGINPLLQCLVLFTKMDNRAYTADALTSGLPVEPGIGNVELFTTKSGKAIFGRAAARAGFSSRLVKKEIHAISALNLPCITLLKDNGACILEAFDADKRHVKIITPEIDEGESWIPIEVLQESYLGYSFYLKKEYRNEDKRSYLVNTEQKHWFWSTLWHSKSIYRDVILASFMINLFVIASPLFTMNVYDRVVPNNAIETLWVLAIGIVVIYAFDLVLKFIRSYFLEVAGKKSDIVMSSILFEHVMDLKIASKPNSVGSFANSLREFDAIRAFFTSGTVTALIDLPFIVLFLVVIYMIAGAIVIVPIVTMILLLLYTFGVKKPLHKSIVSTFSAASQKNSILIESLSAMETIKTLGAAGHAQWLWEESTGEIASRSLKSKMLSSSISIITGFLTQINTVAVIVMGVYMIEEMTLSMGGLIAAVILSSRAIAPMGQVAQLISSFEHTKTALESLNKIMSLPIERQKGKQFVQRSSFEGAIEFKNVSFAYDSKEVLDNISFSIKPGERVGIVGKMGSGKSTIEKLILSMYEPTSGSVLIDGLDINQVDPANLRKNIAYVPQDIVLFSGTIKENILYKAPYATDEDVIRAADISTSHAFIDKHPKGFDMQVGERGEALSGGQRQSVAIARAFLVNTPIVLLDEPSNAMDNTTELYLKKNLLKQTQKRTLLLVTHKPSMLDLVDRLIVMDDGKIALDGAKADVMKALSSNTKGA
jgi:ATP-binding cassette, subfamily C, bacterial LapB